MGTRWAMGLTAGLVAALLLATGCAATREKRTQRIPVVVGRAEERAMPYEIIASGTVEPLKTASVGSQVGGVVTRIAFREGQDVRVGQILFQLDPKPFRASLEQARALSAKSRAQATDARNNADRAQRLLAQNLIAAQEAQASEASAQAQEAQARADSAAVANARLNLRYASIEAPIAGRTGALLVHQGDYVKANTNDPLVTINQIHPILVRFAVPESELPLIQRYREHKPEVRVTPTNEDSVSMVGTLVFVDNAVDRSTGTILLKAEFANTSGALWPGEFVNVHLVLFVEPRACVIPAQAVTMGPNGSMVYVVNGDSTVTPRTVRVARASGELAVIASGVKPGEQVVTDGQMRLAPGAKIEIKTGVGGSPPPSATGNSTANISGGPTRDYTAINTAAPGASGDRDRPSSARTAVASSP